MSMAVIYDGDIRQHRMIVWCVCTCAVKCKANCIYDAFFLLAMQVIVNNTDPISLPVEPSFGINITDLIVGEQLRKLK